MCFFIGLVISAACGFRFGYFTNDDYQLSLLFAKGESHSLYVNFFLSSLMSAIQPSVPSVNVFTVLLVGIVAAAVVMVGFGPLDMIGLLQNIGNGISGMYETILVAVLVSALCGLIRIHGGFAALLDFIHKVFKGHRSGQVGVGLLVSALDIATANNTVAIVMAGPIAKQMGDEYRISPKKTASLLDIFSCVVQGILPYGAQMLVALSAISSALPNAKVSAFDLIPYMFYPFLLLVSVLVFIAISPRKSKA